MPGGHFSSTRDPQSWPVPDRQTHTPGSSPARRGGPTSAPCQGRVRTGPSGPPQGPSPEPVAGPRAKSHDLVRFAICFRNTGTMAFGHEAHLLPELTPTPHTSTCTLHMHVTHTTPSRPHALHIAHPEHCPLHTHRARAKHSHSHDTHTHSTCMHVHTEHQETLHMHTCAHTTGLSHLLPGYL